MSTENEVNGAFPYYVNYYLFQNGVTRENLGDFELSYSNNEYSITNWGYPTINEPTMTQLQQYTLDTVVTFNQSLLDQQQLSSVPFPMTISQTRQNAVTLLGGIQAGALIWNTTTNTLQVWSGTEWKVFATV